MSISRSYSNPSIRFRELYDLHLIPDHEVPELLNRIPSIIDGISQMYPSDGIKFYLTPGAYSRLQNIKNIYRQITINENPEDTTCGTLFNIDMVCSHFGSHPDFYDMENYSFCLQFEIIS